jgi:hypothetical protein
MHAAAFAGSASLLKALRPDDVTEKAFFSTPDSKNR